MKLGLYIGYSGATFDLPVELVQRADRIGFDSVWSSEAYGTDAVTPMAYLAAKTERIRLGTSIMQVAGRPPAMCAMQAQTVDAMAGGNRFIAGLGVSGPQIVEGWYGQPWGSPYYRLRDYMQIMLKIFARESPVSHDGREITLPYPPDAHGSSGLGKPLMSILHPNPRLPIFVGAGGPAMTRLAGELGQGLLPLRFAPGSFEEIAPSLVEGFERAGNGKGWEGFEIQADVHVTITDDPSEARDALKPQMALYVGGMGAVGKNFHNDVMVKAGFPEEARRIQEHYLKGERREAIAAVPDAFIDRTALIGTPDQIRERYQAWARSGITGLTIVSSDPEALELMAQLAAETPAIGPAAAWEAIEADRSSAEAP